MNGTRPLISITPAVNSHQRHLTGVHEVSPLFLMGGTVATTSFTNAEDTTDRRDEYSRVLRKTREFTSPVNTIIELNLERGLFTGQ